MNQIKNLGIIPHAEILCIINVTIHYPYNSHQEDFIYLCKFLESTNNKQLSSDAYTKLAEEVLKGDILELDGTETADIL